MRQNLTKPDNLNKPEHLLRDFLAAGPRNSRQALDAMSDHGLTPKQVRRARELLGVVVQRAGSGTSMHSVWSLPPTEPNIGTARVDESAEGTNEVDEAFLPEAAEGFPNVVRPGARAREGRDDGPRRGAVDRRQVRAREGALKPAASVIGNVSAGAREGLESAAVRSSTQQVLLGALEGQELARECQGQGRGREQDRDGRDARCGVEPHLSAGPLATDESRTDAEQRRHRGRVDVFVARGIDAGTASEAADALVLADRAGRRAFGSCAQCQNLLCGECPVTPKPVVEIHECWYRRQDTP